MIQIEGFVTGIAQENCYLIHNEKTYWSLIQVQRVIDL